MMRSGAENQSTDGLAFEEADGIGGCKGSASASGHTSPFGFQYPRIFWHNELPRRMQKQLLHDHSVFKISKRSIRDLLRTEESQVESTLVKRKTVEAVIPSITTYCADKKRDAARSKASFSRNDLLNYAGQLAVVDGVFGFKGKAMRNDGLSAELAKELRGQIENGLVYSIGVSEELGDFLLKNERCRSLVMRKFSERAGSSALTSWAHRVLNACVRRADKMRAEGYDPFKLNPLAGALRDMVVDMVVVDPLRQSGHFVICEDGQALVLVRSKRAQERVTSRIARLVEGCCQEAIPATEFVTLGCGHAELSDTAFDLVEGICRISLRASSMNALRNELRSITKRSNGEGHAHRSVRIGACLKRHIAQLRAMSGEQQVCLSNWLQKKILCSQYRQQKKVRAKVAFLVRHGVRLERARKLANMRCGHWAFAERYAAEIMPNACLL